MATSVAYCDTAGFPATSGVGCAAAAVRFSSCAVRIDRVRKVSDEKLAAG
jgi:hypothetical protein